jgi:hypothetical protein
MCLPGPVRVKVRSRPAGGPELTYSEERDSLSDVSVH